DPGEAELTAADNEPSAFGARPQLGDWFMTQSAGCFARLCLDPEQLAREHASGLDDFSLDFHREVLYWVMETGVKTEVERKTRARTETMPAMTTATKQLRPSQMGVRASSIGARCHIAAGF